MIQAAAVSTPPRGLFATLKSLFVSSVPVRRAPTVAERADLRGIAMKVATVVDGHGPTGDGELVRYLDREVLEPVRNLIRSGARTWGEPHLGMLSQALYGADGCVGSLHEGLIGRGDMIEALDDFEHALRLVARS